MKTVFTFSAILFATIILAQEPVLLKDFNTKGEDAFWHDPEIRGIALNNQYYLLIDDLKHGEEIWRTNGTTVGTQLLKDIRPGENSSGVVFLGTLGDMLLFRAHDGENGAELWTTLGTTSSTQMIEINPGIQSSSPYDAVILDEALYFSAQGEDGRELYRSEGTPETTNMVRDINPDTTNSGIPYSGDPDDMVVVGGNIFFTANDGEHGREPWKSNGTFGGTTLIKDINEGISSSSINELYPGANKVYFEANDGEHGNELWVSDGTGEGTIMVKDITEGSDGSNITLMEEVNGVFYFIVRESNVERNLWKTDGTEEGTEIVGDGINTRAFYKYANTLYFQGNFHLWKADGQSEEQISDVSIDEWFTGVDDWLYFVGSEGISGNGIWRAHVTTDSVELVKEVTSVSYRDVQYLTGVGDHVYFTAETDSFGNELFVSDGTPEGTFILVDGVPGPEDGYQTYEDISFGAVDNKLLFVGMDAEHGRELWSSEGTVESTALVKDIVTRTKSISLSNDPISYNNETYFMTDTGLWKTDGTPEGTSLVRATELASGLHVLNDKMIFSASAPLINRTIWTSDGTTEGTQPLFDTSNVPATVMLFQKDLPQKDGELYFMGLISGFGYELWKTDGTVEGTMMVKDIYEGGNSSLSSFGGNSIVMGDYLYFIANDGMLGSELWKTDGTEEGTVPISDINPFGSASIDEFTVINDTLYFFADDGTSGHELWKMDGTTENIVMVKDIYPGEKDGVYNFPQPVKYNGMLYFTGNSALHGRELWKSDGTAEGTVMVKDIYPGAGNSNPQNYYLGEELFYFEASDTTGNKLWKSDGTADGTVPLVDMNPLYDMIMIDGILFFTADDGISGNELWRLSPNANDPVQIADILPGSRSANARIVGYHNQVLYFTAYDDIHGNELWTLSPVDPTAELQFLTPEICNSEDTVSLLATVTEAGDNPKFEWYVNNVRIPGANTALLNVSNLNEGDEVKALVVATGDLWIHEDSVFTEIKTIQYTIPVSSISFSDNALTASEGAAYQWYLNDEPLLETSQTITVEQSGIYRVEVSNESGCSSLSDPLVVVVNTTGIEESALRTHIKLYPNPVNTNLQIEAQLGSETKIQIYNTTGNLVYEDLLMAGNIQSIIPMQQLPNGMYLVVFTNQFGSLQHKVMKD